MTDDDDWEKNREQKHKEVKIPRDIWNLTHNDCDGLDVQDEVRGKERIFISDLSNM